jgi:hypothetical protein
MVNGGGGNIKSVHKEEIWEVEDFFMKIQSCFSPLAKEFMTKTIKNSSMASCN